MKTSVASLKKLTHSSEARGEMLQTFSLTDIQTGKATPRSNTDPLTFLVYSLEASVLIIDVPN
jgi:hypothetical protein